MSAVLGTEVEPVGQPEEAIGGADIAMCASNSLDAIFFERWLEPGMHVSSIKQPEIEVKALKSADRVVLHAHEAGPVMSPPEVSIWSGKRTSTPGGHARRSISKSCPPCRS